MFEERDRGTEPRTGTNAAIGLILPIVVEAKASGERESAPKSEVSALDYPCRDACR
jgi:hypothetical protein